MSTEAIRLLVQQQRWAALATLGDAGPIASQVAYAVEPDFRAFLMHLSHLAAHTRALIDHPAVSLSVSEPDDGREDPQTLARVTLFGRAAVVDGSSPAYAIARQRYLARLPAAKPLFGFADFQLIRVEIDQARYVGGFGAARTLDGSALWLPEADRR